MVTISLRRAISTTCDHSTKRQSHQRLTGFYELLLTATAQCILEFEVWPPEMDESRAGAPVAEAPTTDDAHQASSRAHATAAEALAGKSPADGSSTSSPAISPSARPSSGSGGHESPFESAVTTTTGVGSGGSTIGRQDTRHGVQMSTPLDREQIEGLVSGSAIPSSILF